ncbi:MAG: hypothetical protein R2824_23045 [Saprospiraceae bacterium]|nr:hypothetical protein [Lewinella sp.]
MPTLFNSKFIRLLRTLSAEEWRELEQWLQSPWCNSNRNLIVLLAKLQKYHPEFHDRRLSKEKLFRQILPTGKFSERRMNNILSEAFLETERFLVFQRLTRVDDLQAELLNEELQSRQLNDWFFKATEKNIARLEEKTVRDWEDHLRLYRLYRTIYHHPNQENRMLPGSQALMSMEQELDLLYLLEKAAIINEKISRSRILKEETYEIEKSVRKWEVAAEGLAHPSIELYRLRFSREDNPFVKYGRLRKQVLETLNQLNPKEQKIHLLSLINDSIQFVKSGQLELIDLLPMYQLGLETEVLLDNRQITESTYTTVVILSNTKADFEYTYHFMDHYTDKLEENIREDCRQWAKAHTAYWEDDLEKCLDILQQHNFQKFYFQLLGRVLNTQAYFDQYMRDDTYQSFLFNFLDAFEKWMGREKVWSKQNKASFLRFVQKCRALAKLYDEIDFQTDKVEHLLDDASNIQAFDWLQRKQAEVLERRKKVETPR